MSLLISAYNNIIHFANSLAVLAIGEILFLVCREHEEYFSIGTPSLTDVLKLRMFEKGLTQNYWTKLLGGVKLPRSSAHLSVLFAQSRRVSSDSVIGQVVFASFA